MSSGEHHSRDRRIGRDSSTDIDCQRQIKELRKGIDTKVPLVFLPPSTVHIQLDQHNTTTSNFVKTWCPKLSRPEFRGGVTNGSRSGIPSNPLTKTVTFWQSTSSIIWILYSKEMPRGPCKVLHSQVQITMPPLKCCRSIMANLRLSYQHTWMRFWRFSLVSKEDDLVHYDIFMTKSVCTCARLRVQTVTFWQSTSLIIWILYSKETPQGLCKVLHSQVQITMPPLKCCRSIMANLRLSYQCTWMRFWRFSHVSKEDDLVHYDMFTTKLMCTFVV